MMRGRSNDSRKRLWKVVCFCAIFIVFSVIVVYVYSLSFGEKRGTPQESKEDGVKSKAPINDPPPGKHNAKTVYLIQYKDSKFTQKDCFLSDPEKLIQLTYKVQSEDENIIWFPKSTLTEGRNALYLEFLKRYPDINDRPNVCIVDGDAQYGCEMLDVMENYLHGIHDSVYTAAPTYGKYGESWTIYNGRSFWTDGIFQCFPPRSQELFYPIMQSCDHLSWWLSQLVLVLEMHLLFGSCPSNVVPETTVFNAESEPYPRGMNYDCAIEAICEKWGLHCDKIKGCFRIKLDYSEPNFWPIWCGHKLWMDDYEEQCVLRNNPQFFKDKKKHSELVDYLDHKIDSLPSDFFGTDFWKTPPKEKLFKPSD